MEMTNITYFKVDGGSIRVFNVCKAQIDIQFSLHAKICFAKLYFFLPTTNYSKLGILELDLFGLKVLSCAEILLVSIYIYIYIGSITLL